MYVSCGVAEGDELLALGQFDGIEELLVPRHEFLPNPSIAFWSRWSSDKTPQTMMPRMAASGPR
jgi:hypothetical protein